MESECARITYVTGSSKARGAHVVFSEIVKSLFYAVFKRIEIKDECSAGGRE